MIKEISVCMIVKNEEENLPRCLESIKDLVDEIIIVDTGSTDNTVKIAKQYDAKIYYFDWCNDFSAARNESLKYASKDWILIMDADDEFAKEDIDKFKKVLEELEDDIVYFFETLSYLGNGNSENMNVNLNPRLFKNNFGYYYHGKVHNQLDNFKNIFKGKTEPIKIYHYGYTNQNVITKNKRERNMNILKELIKDEPENKFYYFNLGNEYSSLGDIEKALECYYEAFKGFDAKLGYSPKLIERIVISNYESKKFDEALRFIDIGIDSYPKFTDLYLMKGLIFKEEKKYTLAIKQFEKCLQLGEASAALKSIYGAGSFKALDELARLYMDLKDYDIAYNYCIKIINIKPDYICAIYNIAHILNKKNIELDNFKIQIESFFSDFPREYFFIAHLFYSEGYYETALEYIEKLGEKAQSKSEVIYLKAQCLIKTAKYNECIKIINIDKNNPFYFELYMYKMLCLTMNNELNLANNLIEKIDINDLTYEDKKRLQVYRELVKLFLDENSTVLSENQDEKGYTPIIIEILDILILNKEYDKFEKALGLLNLISDKTVLLQLGRLYYENKYLDMAKKEIIRSIKIFDEIDNQSIEILKELIDIKV